MKRLIFTASASLCMALTACGDGGNDPEKTISLEGEWQVSVQSDSHALASAKGVMQKTTSGEQCVVTAKLADGETLGDHDGLYFPHYTWHVTDKTTLSGEALPSNWFSQEFVTNWCEKDGYKAVTKTDMTIIINKLNQLEWGKTHYPNMPCELSEFDTNKVVLKCEGGLVETYTR